MYRARDVRLGRTVAIKLLPIHLSNNPELKARLEREARMISSLSHPSICVLYDVGHESGMDFLVFEYLEGETMAQRLSRGPMPLEDVLKYGEQIAGALESAHRSGVIHRDLKPENVILTQVNAKLLDFGIARWIDEGPDSSPGSSAKPTRKRSLTEEGTILGTVQYMAPEQLQGADVDRRADLFALGAILYEMTTGMKAFPGANTPAIVGAILSKDPLPASGVVSRTPAALDDLIRKCLRKDPSERCQSATEARAQLERIAAGDLRTQQRHAIRWVQIVRLLVPIALVFAVVALFRAFSPPPIEKSIAVLPFLNLSGNKQDDYFSDGMTEDVITQLAKIGGLKVISRTSVMQYKNTNKSLREIGKELDVATILEGSVQRSGNRVRIVGQLIDARSDQHLWAETYDREMKDIFAIESDVAEQIAAALDAKLSPEEKQRMVKEPTVSLSAFDCYLKGREYYYRFTSEDNERAVELFSKALQLDPNFALAYAGLGDAYASRVVYGYPSQWYDSAIDVSRKAISIDPNLSEGYESLAYALVFRGRLTEALGPARKALELKPSYGRAASVLGRIYLRTGRLDQALPLMKKYASLNPTSGNALKFVGIVHMKLGDMQEARRWFERSIELEPEYVESYEWLLDLDLEEGNFESAGVMAIKLQAFLAKQVNTHESLGEWELFQRNYEEAGKHFAAALQADRSGSSAFTTPAGFCLWKVGKKEEAQALLERSLRYDRDELARGNEDGEIPCDMAFVYSIQGNQPEALPWMQKALDAGTIGFPFFIAKNPLSEGLRDNPQFQQMMSSLQQRIKLMRVGVQNP